MSDRENEGYGRGIHHSMANINLYKSHAKAFFASSNRFRDTHISEFVILKTLVTVVMYSIHSGTIRR